VRFYRSLAEQSPDLYQANLASSLLTLTSALAMEVVPVLVELEVAVPHLRPAMG
jgi:hypothetical protein